MQLKSYIMGEYLMQKRHVSFFHQEQPLRIPHRITTSLKTNVGVVGPYDKVNFTNDLMK